RILTITQSTYDGVIYNVEMLKQILGFFLMLLWSSSSLATSKEGLLDKCAELKAGLEKRLLEVDNLIGRKIDEIDLPSDGTLKVEKIVLKRIGEAREAREEIRLRLEIMEHLKEKLVLHYNGQDLKVFLQDQISTLARNELGLGSRARDDSEIVTALLYLKAAMKVIKLDGLELLVWMDKFMESSGVRNPADLQPLFSSADYSNRISTESNPVQKEAPEPKGSKPPEGKIDVQNLRPDYRAPAKPGLNKEDFKH
ncbi:MAG: hypothetical protein K2X47_20600, partial [Bdellovibrionales bacterium]|nr:hypothetical protein [Bdellovibrionales bacterium]